MCTHVHSVYMFSIYHRCCASELKCQNGGSEARSYEPGWLEPAAPLVNMEGARLPNDRNSKAWIPGGVSSRSPLFRIRHDYRGLARKMSGTLQKEVPGVAWPAQGHLRCLQESVTFQRPSHIVFMVSSRAVLEEG